MPIFYESWPKLRAKLESTDPPTVKRVGVNKTLIVPISLQVRNPKYPILSDKLLERWFNNKGKSPHEPESVRERVREPEPEPVRDKGPLPEPEPESDPGPEPEPQHEEGPFFNQGNGYPENDDDNEVQPVEEMSNGSIQRSPQAFCRGSIDELVISEPIIDEFAQFNDDDDDDEEKESTLTRNLKKIKSNIPKPTSMPPPAQPPPRRSSAPCPGQPPKSSPATKPTPPPKPQEPPKPDWSRTRQQLERNEYHSVYQDLNFFKEQAKIDPAARNVVKDTITKAFADDKTGPLIDILKLITETSFYHEQPDVDFWSEIIKRFKRKLQPPGKMVFKTMDNSPETVLHHYKMAFMEARDYIKNANLTLALQHNDFEFLVNFDRIHDIKPRIKVERQENTSPEPKRRVAMSSKDLDGNPVFNISRPATTLTRKPFSNKL